MRLKTFIYFVLGTLVCTQAKLKSHHHHRKFHEKIESQQKLHHNHTRAVSAGAKRTWECHRGCLQFCLPSCKKSCCQPGARDFTPAMIEAIEKYQGEVKGVAEQRTEIGDDSEEIQPFACGQFCSPECTPSCTIGCCTELIPKDDSNTPKHGGYQVAPALRVMLQKPDREYEPLPVPKIGDIQKILEMPCGEYCSAHCSPACSPDCCNNWGDKRKTSTAKSRQLSSELEFHRRPDIKAMYRKALSTCHIDCEKLCLPACEFVCCVPSKMREIRFTKDVEMRFGLRKTLD